jgi:hypothetical protein
LQSVFTGNAVYDAVATLPHLDGLVSSTVVASGPASFRPRSNLTACTTTRLSGPVYRLRCQCCGYLASCQDPSQHHFRAGVFSAHLA